MGNLTYNAHMKYSSSCLKVDSASRSAIRDIMMEASSSFLVREIARCSSSPERALSSFSLIRRDFSRRSSSSYVIRCNRREVEGTLWMSNRDAFPIGSTRLRFWRADVGSGSDAATIVLQFQGEGLPAEEIKGIPWRLLSLDDLRVVTVFESSFLGMKAILMRRRKWLNQGQEGRVMDLMLVVRQRSIMSRVTCSQVEWYKWYKYPGRHGRLWICMQVVTPGATFFQQIYRAVLCAMLFYFKLQASLTYLHGEKNRTLIDHCCFFLLQVPRYFPTSALCPTLAVTDSVSSTLIRLLAEYCTVGLHHQLDGFCSTSQS